MGWVCFRAGIKETTWRRPAASLCSKLPWNSLGNPLQDPEAADWGVTGQTGPSALTPGDVEGLGTPGTPHHTPAIIHSQSSELLSENRFPPFLPPASVTRPVSEPADEGIYGLQPPFIPSQFILHISSEMILSLPEHT